MNDAVVRIDPLARLLARFAYENRIAGIRRIRAFLGLDTAAFSSVQRRWGWERRAAAPSAARLEGFLAAYEGIAACDAGETTPPPETRTLTLRLRTFVAQRLADYADGDAAGSGGTPTRDIVALTRCLKELLALEAKIDWNASGGRGEGDGATMDGGPASDLAEIVALQIEQLHERVGTGGGLEALYAADEASSGCELAASGAGGSARAASGA